MHWISPRWFSASSGGLVEAAKVGCGGPEGEGMVGFSVIIFRRNSLSAASSSKEGILSSSEVIWYETHVVEGGREGGRNCEFQ